MKAFLLSALLVAPVFADFARVCTANSQFAPLASNCTQYDQILTKNYPSGYIKLDDMYNGCKTIYANGFCRMAVCAFPYQGVDLNLAKTAIKDILTNCNSPTGQTGGYNIITGTNITIGVFGGQIPYEVKPLTADSTSATANDCNQVIAAINTTATYAQNSAAGCNVVATKGTCALGYCDRPGSTISGSDLQAIAIGLSLNLTSKSSKMEGFAELSAFSTKRISFSSVGKPASVLLNQYVCYDTQSSPAGSDCQNAANALTATNLQQGKVTGCTLVGRSGGCQINLCGPTSAQVLTSAIQSAIKSIISQCPGSIAGHAQGYARIAGSDNTISISGITVQQNIWCNPAPNNSPTFNEAYQLSSLVNTSTIYSVDPTLWNQGCRLIAKKGTAKLSYCSTTSTSISGADLAGFAGNIARNCLTNIGPGYSSGVLQITNTSSLSVYDPPGSNYVYTSDPNGNLTIAFSNDTINVGLQKNQIQQSLYDQCGAGGVCDSRNYTIMADTFQNQDPATITISVSGTYRPDLKNALLDAMNTALSNVTQIKHECYQSGVETGAGPDGGSQETTCGDDAYIPGFWSVYFPGTSDTPEASISVTLSANDNIDSDFCKYLTTVGSAVAGAVKGYAGGAFTLLGLACPS